jgi:hypothetical protein
MPEKGFYHPTQGYWQTLSTPTAAQLAAYPEGTVEIPVQPSEDKRWNGSAWVDNPDYVAEQLAIERANMRVSRFQAKAALAAAGLLTQAQAVVDAADATTQLAWNEVIEFRRNSPTIAALQAAMSLTDTQLDELFRAAALIEA